MNLPRYVTLAKAAEGITKYRYNPPQDAVDAGVVARRVLGTIWIAPFMNEVFSKIMGCTFILVAACIGLGWL